MLSNEPKPKAKPPYNKILIVIIVILVAGLSITAGTMLTSFFHPIQNNTFSNSGISFQYPGNWSNNATITWNSANNNTQNETIGTLGNGNVTLAVLYIPEFSSYNIQSLSILSVAAWKTSGVNEDILSNTVNQVGQNSVDQIIYTENDPVTGVLYKTDYVLIGGSGKAVYALVFRAPEADFSKYYSQFQSIISSVTLANQAFTNTTITNTTTATQTTNQTTTANQPTTTSSQQSPAKNSTSTQIYKTNSTNKYW